MAFFFFFLWRQGKTSKEEVTHIHIFPVGSLSCLCLAPIKCLHLHSPRVIKAWVLLLSSLEPKNEEVSEGREGWFRSKRDSEHCYPWTRRVHIVNQSEEAFWHQEKRSHDVGKWLRRPLGSKLPSREKKTRCNEIWEWFCILVWHRKWDRMGGYRKIMFETKSHFFILQA